MDNYNSKSDNIKKERVTVNSLDMMVSAMWELMIDKGGFTREQMNAKLDEIKEQKVTLDPKLSKVICPVCGKIINETKMTPFEGNCLYCGHKMTIYPGDSIVFAKDNDPLPDNGSSTLDDQNWKE